MPFVAQEPLLCGGAAAAMLLRFWGERHVHGDDFEHLVRPEEGGIATTDLVEEIRRRGYETRLLPSPEDAFRALDRDVPSILLLEGGPTLHYVVLVRAGPRYVWIHDPNFGPDRRLRREELSRLWAASGHWAVAVTPGDGSADSPGSAGGSDESTAGITGVQSEATRAGPDTPATAAVQEALQALRQGSHPQARARARAIVDDPPSPMAASRARRILATSFYLDGGEVEALRHWNALSEPTIDLVEIRGARHSRHHVLARRLGLQPGSLLTPLDLRLARRRLGDLDALRRVRVDYRPLPDGSAEVQAFVTERRRWPGPRDGAALLVAAASDRRASLEVGPFIASADRWRLEGAWQGAQSLAGASLSTPTPHLPGIVSVGLEWRRERFGDLGSSPSEPTSPVSEMERLRGFLELAEWVTPWLAVRGSLGVERWPSRQRVALLGVGTTWHALEDNVRVSFEANHWRGGLEPFSRGSASFRLRQPLAPPVEIRVSGGATAVSASAPPLLWPGAGVGEIRGPLLRGHPLAEDGAITGSAFGRRLVHASGEVRLSRRLGPLQYGGAVFVDLARAWERSLDGAVGGGSADLASASPLLVDPGLGLFVDLSDRELRVDLARGDSSWMLTAGVRTPY